MEALSSMIHRPLMPVKKWKWSASQQVSPLLKDFMHQYFIRGKMTMNFKVQCTTIIELFEQDFRCQLSHGLGRMLLFLREPLLTRRS